MLRVSDQGRYCSVPVVVTVRPGVFIRLLFSRPFTYNRVVSTVLSSP